MFGYLSPSTEKLIAVQVELTSLNISGGKPVASKVIKGGGTFSPYGI